MIKGKKWEKKKKRPKRFVVDLDLASKLIVFGQLFVELLIRLKELILR